jgi:peptide/nickel transport system permease protein
MTTELGPAPSEPVPPEGETPPGRPRRRPNPRMDQFRRTWYFFRRNTLAMVGFGILIFFVAAFLYGLVYQGPTTQLDLYCATDGSLPAQSTCPVGNIAVCTYPQGTTSPGPNCYQTPVVNGIPYSNFIPPTVSATGLGPLPFGALIQSGQVGSPYFYNLYAGLVKGTDWSLSISVAIVLSGAITGLMVGVVAGFYGGVVDEVLMRLTDIFLSVPQILLVIVVILAGQEVGIQGFDNRIYLMVAAFIATWWPVYARIVRGQVLVVREQKYVEAARASGAGGGRIVRRHVLPNSVYPVFVQMSLDVGTVPLLIAAIVYIGFPIFPNVLWPEWGSIAAESTLTLPSLLQTCAILGGGSACPFPWWQLLFPGLALFLFAISVNFVADGLRDALDPRLRR